jgi:solute carrier family 25 carnitine/acylcarnitine transporter 20/29
MLMSMLMLCDAHVSGGFSYWLGTYPIDVVKSAMMADSNIKSQRRYKGVLDTFQKLYAERGVKGFFRGLSPCLIRAAPANGVCFMLYEMTVKMMD